MNPAYRDYETAETFAFADGIIMKVLLSGSESNGLQEIFEDIVEPGVGPPRHIHHEQDETFIFLEGTFDVEIDGKVQNEKRGCCSGTKRYGSRLEKCRRRTRKTYLHIYPCS